MPKLTKRVVDAAEIRPKPYFIPCSELRGFKLRVFPSGKKSYVLDYYADGKRSKMTLAQHGVLTVDQARKLAIENLGKVVRGGNPLADRIKRRTEMTIRQLCERYLEDVDKGHVQKKKSTIETDKGRINRHIIPLLGDKRVRDLTAPDVVQFVADVTDGKTAVDEKTGHRGRARVTGGAGTASKSKSLLGAILAYAIDRGIAENNVAHGVKSRPDGKRKQRLVPDQYRLFGRALETAEDRGEAWQGVAGARLAALTGWRFKEILTLKWTDIDFDTPGVDLEETKTGDQIRPIGKPAVALLNSLERRDGCPYVFPAIRGDAAAHYANLDTALDRIIALEPDLTRFTAHILRHAFNSVGADLNIPEEVRRAIVGQSSQGINAQYTHHLPRTLIDAADRISGEIARQMSGFPDS